jgi:lysophospholipase L1-like esterase
MPQARPLAWLLAIALCALCLPQAARAQTGGWVEEMAAFSAEDQDRPFAEGGILFVGSSSIRLWDLQRSFPGMAILNRGFGGSQISDSIAHVDRLILRHHPRLVVFYAGDNDIASGKAPTTVAADFRTLVRRVHEALPKARIAFIGIKPSLQRWKLIDNVRAANAQIRRFAETDERIAFIDVDGPMLGWNERPRADLFVEDGLHLSPKGYELWTALVRPFLE